MITFVPITMPITMGGDLGNIPGLALLLFLMLAWAFFALTWILIDEWKNKPKTLLGQVIYLTVIGGPLCAPILLATLMIGKFLNLVSDKL